jgi:hypothetical protein
MLTYRYPARKPMETIAPSRPWTAEEIANLARAFIDLDLDGIDLHRWCQLNGINRTRGAIDKKLHDLAFFDPCPPAANHNPRRDRAKITTAAKWAAEANLRNQIKLAKLELAAGSIEPYKPGSMEW